MLCAVRTERGTQERDKLQQCQPSAQLHSQRGGHRMRTERGTQDRGKLQQCQPSARCCACAVFGAGNNLCHWLSARCVAVLQEAGNKNIIVCMRILL